MEKTNKKLTALKIIAEIVFKGLLSNILVRISFLLIFACLLASCIFESKADILFGSFINLSKGKIDMDACPEYLSRYAAHLLFGWLHNFIFYSSSQFMKSIIFQFLLKKYLALNFHDFNELGTGKVHSFINRQADATIFFLSNIVLTLFYSIFYLILFYIKLFRNQELSFALKLVFVGILLLMLSFMFISCIVSFYNKSAMLQEEHTSSHFLFDILKNFTVVKAFNSESLECHKLAQNMHKQIKLGYIFYRFETLSTIFFKLFMTVGIVLVIIYKESSSGLFQITGQFSCFLSALLAFKKHMNTLRESIFKINDKFIESVTCEVHPTKKTTKQEKLEGKTGKIEFSDVSIHLNENLIFDDLTIKIDSGEKIAITGRNGMGKSTIMKALMGMEDYKGVIFINNIDISTIDEKSLRDFIAYVPQEPHLFDTTVMSNLKYGKEISDEEVFVKCKECGVHDIFKNLENGYGTVVGENCRNISGGQAQLINFMRAFIKDSPIFILDEPTSNLDYSTTKKLMDMVFNLLKDKTVFLTTHDPAHLTKFDKILNISGKKISIYKGYDEFVRDGSFELKM